MKPADKLNLAAAALAAALASITTIASAGEALLSPPPAAAEMKPCCAAVSSRAALLLAVAVPAAEGAKPPGMVWIPGGEFAMGGTDKESRKDEAPVHRVKVDGFWMDETEVTNAQFRKFVEATQYVTTAERKPDWEDLKKQLPPGTPKPDDSMLVPGSMIFKPTDGPVPLNDWSQWWSWAPGASWQHPHGPHSSLDKDHENYPVVHVSWDDAAAFCKWASKRLPTEAEWECAARGGEEGKHYTWGDEFMPGGKFMANTWQGKFPYEIKPADGFLLAAPVKGFPPNAHGLYDMAGNVWEWCADWYRADYYATSPAVNPHGPADSLDPDEPHMPKRVNRGGSFLCNEEYCASYRPAARMKTTPDSGQIHLGFRCAMSAAASRDNPSAK